MLAFQLPIKAFSVNGYYYKTRSMKTVAACDWETLACAHLARIPGMTEVANAWRAQPRNFKVTMRFVYPMHVYFNRQGAVSAKTFDLSNVEKPLLDMIFRETLGIDDRFVTTLISTKRAGADYAIEVLLEFESEANADAAVSATESA